MGCIWGTRVKRVLHLCNCRQPHGIYSTTDVYKLPHQIHSEYSTNVTVVSMTQAQLDAMDLEVVVGAAACRKLA